MLTVKLGDTPAYPSHGSMGEVAHQGMTLRQYYAGLAMQALIANPARYEYISGLMEDSKDRAGNNYRGLTQEQASAKNAHKAVLLADTLLAALENSNEPR